MIKCHISGSSYSDMLLMPRSSMAEFHGQRTWSMLWESIVKMMRKKRSGDCGDKCFALLLAIDFTSRNLINSRELCEGTRLTAQMLNYARLACHVVPKILHSSKSTLVFYMQPDTQLLLVRLLGLSADEIWWNYEMLLGVCKSPSDTEDVKGGTQKEALFITLPCNLQSQCITNFCKSVCRSMNLNPAEMWKKELCFADAIISLMNNFVQEKDHVIDELSKSLWALQRQVNLPSFLLQGGGYFPSRHHDIMTMCQFDWTC